MRIGKSSSATGKWLPKPSGTRKPGAEWAAMSAIRFYDFGHSHAQSCIVDHDHLPSRDQAIVDVDVDRLTQTSVEFNHSTAPELQELRHLHGRLAEDGTDRHRNVVDCLQFLDRTCLG